MSVMFIICSFLVLFFINFHPTLCTSFKKDDIYYRHNVAKNDLLALKFGINVVVVMIVKKELEKKP